jgi:regulator of G-protein signaling
VLEFPTFREHFSNHINREYSGENLGFWTAVEDYRFLCSTKGANSSTVAPEALKIFDEFVSNEAPRQVNLQGPTSKMICEFFAGDYAARPLDDFVRIFDAAAIEIYKMMGADSFGRFKRAPEFTTILALLEDMYKDLRTDSIAPSPFLLKRSLLAQKEEHF